METPAEAQPILPEYHLNQTLDALSGTNPIILTSFNQWAAVALDLYHSNSRAKFDFELDGVSSVVQLVWNSNFERGLMRERKHIAEDGGVALALFIMSVLLGYRYVLQSEIGEGVDYGFTKETLDPENFFKNCHFTEISGLLEEKGSNTLINRIKQKHEQITKGIRSKEICSVIVTHFQKPITVKENHL
jgi:hypothetical protein